MRKNLIVLQEGGKDCGSAALLSIIRYYGGDISLDKLVEMTKTTKEGTNFYSLSLTASELGLASRGYKVDDISKIKEISPPFNAQVHNNNFNHFIVIYKVSNDKVLIMDPAVGKCLYDIFEFGSIWTGYILVFEKVKPLPQYKNEHILNKIIIRTLLQNKGIILAIIILSVFFILSATLTSMYSQKVFDEVVDTDLNNLVVVTFTFSILLIFKNITSYVRNYLIIYLNQKLDISLIISTFSHIILLPYIYFRNKTTSEVLSRINDLSFVKNFISKLIVTIFLDLLMFIAAFFIVYHISQKIAFLVAFISCLHLLIVIIFNPFIKKNTKLNQENNAIINNTIIESVNSYETIKGLNIEGSTILKFSNIYTKGLNDMYYSEKINNLLIISKNIVADFGTLFISFICFQLIMTGIMDVGKYMTVTILLPYLIIPCEDIVDIINDFYYTKSSIARAGNLLENEVEKIAVEKRLDVFGNIIIKDLDYTFNNKNYIIQKLNLEIKSREKVLIMGASGSGKSTLLKLIYHYYPIERGKILINSYDINDYSLSDIRKKIVYISQNEILYSNTIRNNILLERKVDTETFLRICQMTKVDEIVNNHLEGYDYFLEENGANISGGQRQRIILARSLLKDSNIIMIDEGFSQIDIDLERKILKNIFYYFTDKTIIIVSHRKENMDLYNRVITIENGNLKNNLVRKND